ncbi:MAG TPA: dethiobiotin synthase [Usitatibacteraceae bacterium]
MKSYFITGTDTGVGKTLVTAALMHALQSRGLPAAPTKPLRVAPMKPVAAGTIAVGNAWLNEDVALLQEISQYRFALADVNPYCLAEGIAPHIAAAHEHVNIDLETIRAAFARLRANADMVLVEGAGGFLVPLAATQSMADIPVALQLDVILVVAMRLGCLNHALLTAAAIRARGLHLAGWVANSASAIAMNAFDENLSTLQAMLDAPCLGVIPFVDRAGGSGGNDPAAAARAAAMHLRIDSINA